MNKAPPLDSIAIPLVSLYIFPFSLFLLNIKLFLFLVSSSFSLSFSYRPENEERRKFNRENLKINWNIQLKKKTLKIEVLLSPDRRKKEDRIGESQPFWQRTLPVQDKVHPGRKPNSWPSTCKAPLFSKLTRLALTILYQAFREAL
jgi:hypothetical protein